MRDEGEARPERTPGAPKPERALLKVLILCFGSCNAVSLESWQATAQGLKSRANVPILVLLFNPCDVALYSFNPHTDSRLLPTKKTDRMKAELLYDWSFFVLHAGENGCRLST